MKKGRAVNFRKKVLEMDRVFGLGPVAICCIMFSVLITDCLSVAAADDKGGYFLFTPPFGGDRLPQEVAASQRIGAGFSNDVAPIGRATIAPAESLWIGSHKINWGPLPLFQKFLDHHQQKQQRIAQARKFDLENQQQQDITKKTFLIGGGSFKDGIFGRPNQPHHHNKEKSFFHNPHHDYSNKFASGGFFAGLNAALAKGNAPPVIPPKFAEPRSSNQPENDFNDFNPVIPGTLMQPQRNTPPFVTTPLPYIQSSTGGTILVSPPGAIRALSTPGPSINPIIDRLRKMTEWSKQSQKSGLVKKEGKPDSHLERKLRLKKRLRPDAKAHKHNIEAIILSNDEDDFNESLSVERDSNKENQQASVNNTTTTTTTAATSTTKNKKVSSKSKKKSRKGKKGSSMERNNENGSDSMEEIPINTRAVHRPRSNIVIVHPTNAAFLNEPLDGQQTALNYQVKRKDKQMGVFSNKNEDFAHLPAPVSFRFGAQDAKLNPYATF